jgi:hypothetical protein
MILLAMLAAALLASGCARVGTGEDDPEGQVIDGILDSSATAPVLAARRLHDDASAHHRFAEADGRESAPVIAAPMGPPSFSTHPGGKAAAQGSRMAPGMVMALLKASAAPSVAATVPGIQAVSALPAAPPFAAGDTTGLRYGDSAKGYIQQVRSKPFTDSLGAGTLTDSLVYRWPFSPTSPTVLSHVRRLAYADGRRAGFVIVDEDGDGILNEASPGKSVMLRRTWSLVSGDTAWKTVSHTVHGQTTLYDSLGGGRLSTWSDSAFFAGRMVWWRRTYDGDGDGFVLSAAASAKPRILRDASSTLSDGSLRLDYEAFGAGPDGDYLKEADNDRHAWRSAVVDSRGRDVEQVRHGDADGDGLYWSAAPGAKNRVFSTHVRAATEGVPAYSDSLVQDLPALGSGASEKPRLVSFTSRTQRLDRTVSTLSLRLPPGVASSGVSDTVQIRETLAFAAYVPRSPSDSLADLDSVVTVLWIVPGDPESDSDDRLTQWHRREHFKTGRPLLSAAVQVRGDAPFAPVELPASGLLLREEIYRPTTAQALSRSLVLREFGGTGPKPWKRTDWFATGDSAVSSGLSGVEGPSTYARELGPEARCSGWRDAKTGEFRDTVVRLDAKGKAAFREAYEGVLKPSDGTGSFFRRRLGAGADTTAVRYAVTRGTDGLELSRVSGSDTVRIRWNGDTASVTETLGGLTVRGSWHPEGGAYRVIQTKTETAGGKARGGADYSFGSDGAGAGVDTRISADGMKREGAVRFRADGTVHYDGVKVPTGN